MMKYEFSYSTYFQYLSEQIRRIAPDMEKTALKDEQLISLKDRINKIDKLASTQPNKKPILINLLKKPQNTFHMVILRRWYQLTCISLREVIPPASLTNNLSENHVEALRNADQLLRQFILIDKPLLHSPLMTRPKNARSTYHEIRRLLENQLVNRALGIEKPYHAELKNLIGRSEEISKHFNFLEPDKITNLNTELKAPLKISNP